MDQEQDSIFFFLSNSKKYIVSVIDETSERCFASIRNSADIDILNGIMAKGQFLQMVPTEGWS